MKMGITNPFFFVFFPQGCSLYKGFLFVTSIVAPDVEILMCVTSFRADDTGVECLWQLCCGALCSGSARCFLSLFCFATGEIFVSFFPNPVLGSVENNSGL
jgi:hypothetical protein